METGRGLVGRIVKSVFFAQNAFRRNQCQNVIYLQCSYCRHNHGRWTENKNRMNVPCVKIDLLVGHRHNERSDKTFRFPGKNKEEILKRNAVLSRWMGKKKSGNSSERTFIASLHLLRRVFVHRFFLFRSPAQFSFGRTGRLMNQFPVAQKNFSIFFLDYYYYSNGRA